MLHPQTVKYILFVYVLFYMNMLILYQQVYIGKNHICHGPQPVLLRTQTFHYNLIISMQHSFSSHMTAICYRIISPLMCLPVYNYVPSLSVVMVTFLSSHIILN